VGGEAQATENPLQKGRPKNRQQNGIHGKRSKIMKGIIRNHFGRGEYPGKGVFRWEGESLNVIGRSGAGVRDPRP